MHPRLPKGADARRPAAGHPVAHPRQDRGAGLALADQRVDPGLVAGARRFRSGARRAAGLPCLPGRTRLQARRGFLGVWKPSRRMRDNRGLPAQAAKPLSLYFNG
ncbi:hypothetical protein VARIO8X_20139 [Burkholderiales bacterium 8X]|nr:hypothetical protein VARIO8X_20139 [Burkholderiales bacterium 8X]